MRGPTVMSGYLDAPELNRSVFVDGWFRTGDIGSLDADGFLTLHGREKELINRGSEKIAPLEIDQALMRIRRSRKPRPSACRIRGSARMSRPPWCCTTARA